ncbi:MAG: DNA-binding protein [Mycoplasmataceae bacterium]|jgi:predicted DNA-binding protein with PD1-like motif|nr:DNA-binding protein [Mycoplasmataceae bacterium]
MRHTKLDQNHYCLILDKNEEIITSITSFCNDEKINNASFEAIGAVAKVTIGIFDKASKKYNNHTLTGDLEIISLLGNVVLKDNKPFAHAHIIVSDETCTCKGGHLINGNISLTCEIFITTYEKNIRREPDISLGIATIKFN